MPYYATLLSTRKEKGTLTAIENLIHVSRFSLRKRINSLINPICRINEYQVLLDTISIYTLIRHRSHPHRLHSVVDSTVEITPD